MTKLLKGKPVADDLLNQVKKFAKNNQLKMAIIQIGDDSASSWYRRFKIKTAKKLNIETIDYQFGKDENEDKIIKTIRQLNTDSEVNGIFLEQPIIGDFNRNNIVESISGDKDIDGITEKNCGKLYLNREGLFPATAKSIIKILDFYNIKIKGKRIVIVGRSNIVGKPVAFLFMHRHGTITICHSRTKNLDKVVKEGEIVVAAVGKAKLIGEEFISENAVVIDAGYNLEGDNVYGDVDFENAKTKAKAITPVPNGVGKVTTAMIFNNLVQAYKYQNDK
ncbi:MAG: bifunctional 5,10-methylenetetrahydrofolate dehydrogenase/5,10-methenyltetrahydrofolate cyclohydrolase [Candidatus Mcinerneyibacterium aminivorans]|uniref:Bifunctional protein FolD n=1 Tax=Candidatus Mcinerneyibacterium aminivorans TaxID=2703815 RepID=A0A5D0MI29_9BACT|nr:MAG: bifunctional 5,10-methylenetetrahydrofolate dehydrogenase/5,10-methenyltetrahydrofolate cyclohydrolase [Candidatus Mcinerneyibacterium aminivorans]